MKERKVEEHALERLPTSILEAILEATLEDFRWHFGIRRILYVGNATFTNTAFPQATLHLFDVFLYRAITKIVNVSCCNCDEKSIENEAAFGGDFGAKNPTSGTSP